MVEKGLSESITKIKNIFRPKPVETSTDRDPVKTEPEVKIDPELESDLIPYRVEVNPKLFAELLHDFGVTNEKIAQLTVVPKKVSKKGYLGGYDKINKEIIVFIQPFWETYLESLDTATKITTGELEPKESQFKKLLTTKRLSKYLSEAPPERAMAFTKKMLEKGLNKKTNEIAIHESGHAIDFNTKNQWKLLIGQLVAHMGLNVTGQALAYGQIALIATLKNNPTFLQNMTQNPHIVMAAFVSGLGLQATLNHFITPVEISAKQFANNLSKNEKWLNLIKIIPKNEKDTPLGRLKASGYTWGQNK